GNPIFDRFGSLARRPSNCRVTSAASHALLHGDCDAARALSHWDAWRLALGLVPASLHVAHGVAYMMLLRRTCCCADGNVPRAW
ncbi:hypothetical protein HAX54_053058, partial [Datura stramonium]|nr:hypothetical protein [Datura stramonium]